MERAQTRPLRGIATALALSGFLTLGSCRGSERSFEALLAKIDASPVSASTFIGAARLAANTEERLRLLKRASIREGSIYPDTAAAILASGMVTESVAIVALDAFLSSARYDEALALFEGPLDPLYRPGYYAETLTLAIRDGLSLKPTVDRFILSADASDDTRFLVYAAVEAMLGGDRERARTLLVDSDRMGTSNGYRAPYRLLWDAGALDLLSGRKASDDDPFEHALIADAEFLSGRVAEASASYAYLIRHFPSWSWKPYAALARFNKEQAEATTLAWPHAPDPDTYSVLSSAVAMKSHLYELMYQRFPDSQGALLEYARWQYDSGKIKEARQALSRLDGEAARIARLRYEEPERIAAEALRLVADYPLSIAAYDAAMLSLARVGSWKRFEELQKKSEASGIHSGLSWFWLTVRLALAGDPDSALSELRRVGPASFGYPGLYDLGVLERSASHPQEAAEAFIKAAGVATKADERALAYIMAGDAWCSITRYDQAKAAYEAALGADNTSRQARSRLERLRSLAR